MDQYKKFQTHHDLPEFKVLDQEFEVTSISVHEYPLKEIRRHIAEKLSTNAEILEDIIHPNSTISAYHECKFFNEDEKRELYDLYARLMAHIRSSNVLDVKSTDEKDAQYITQVFNDWQNLKSKLHTILVKMKDSWSADEIIDKSMSSYFG